MCLMALYHDKNSIENNKYLEMETLFLEVPVCSIVKVNVFRPIGLILREAHVLRGGHSLKVMNETVFIYVQYWSIYMVTVDRSFRIINNSFDVQALVVFLAAGLGRDFGGT